MARWLGLLLLAAAFLFTFIGGAEEEAEIVLPALLLGGGGLWVWDRATRAVARDIAVPPPEDRGDRLARIEVLLESAQTDPNALRDTRDFFERLYGGRSGGRLPESTTEHPSSGPSRVGQAPR